MKKTVRLFFFFSLFLYGPAFAEPVNRYLKQSLQELMDIELTSASKRAQPLSRTAAAAFILTQEDIRRSGATSLPELLRGIPGLEVAQVNTHRWAVTARGFNGVLANKLLVLIDGRSVYTPLYAGVYWDTQDLIFEDIERIEVIRGPGGAVWGSNAVNGVINVITKRAADTRSNLAKTVIGDEERILSLRHGAGRGENVSYRAYGKFVGRDEGHAGNDEFGMGRGGFRLDNAVDGENTHVFTADAYNGAADYSGSETLAEAPFSRRLLEDEGLYGGHLLYRWEHVEDDRRDSQLQFYFDHNSRDQVIFEESRWTADADWQKRLPLGDRHKFSWGAGYRLMGDETNGSFTASFDPTHVIDQLYSAYTQDEITISPDRFWLTVGSKFEYNDYSGFEAQPSVRALYALDGRRSVWAAVSRAVRIPTRLDEHVLVARWQTPGVTLLRAFGDSARRSEEVIAYEAGYRVEATDRLSLDWAAFFNEYRNLTTTRAEASYAEQGYTVNPFVIDDRADAETYGAELAARFQATPAWRLLASYAFLQMQVHARDDALGGAEGAEGQSPHNQFSLISRLDLPAKWELDAQLRYVDSLPRQRVDHYVELDLRVGWRPREDLELSVVGKNLLNDHHREFAAETDLSSSQSERSVYGRVTWWF